MTPPTRTEAALAIVAAGVLYYPQLLPLAAGAGVLLLGHRLLFPPQRRTVPVRVIGRLPTAYERRQARRHSRWLPGLGFGLRLPSLRPILFLSIWRWRR